MQDLGAKRSHLKHFFIGDARHLPRPGLDAGIGRVNAVHIRVDIAACADRSSDRHGTRIRTASAERGYAPVGADTLKAGDDSHLPLFEPL